MPTQDILDVGFKDPDKRKEVRNFDSIYIQCVYYWFILMVSILLHLNSHIGKSLFLSWKASSKDSIRATFDKFGYRETTRRGT